MKIPYGNANFAEIRKKGMFYVDKTRFLAELERDDLGYKNLVFLRPRRFGKSSLVSMMDHYYDVSHAHQFDELFRGLWIHEHPTPEKNRHMVLKLDFSQLSMGHPGDANARTDDKKLHSHEHLVGAQPEGLSPIQRKVHEDAAHRDHSHVPHLPRAQRERIRPRLQCSAADVSVGVTRW